MAQQLMTSVSNHEPLDQSTVAPDMSKLKLIQVRCSLHAVVVKCSAYITFDRHLHTYIFSLLVLVRLHYL